MPEEARPAHDPLADLRERLEATRAAAEQLAGEAAGAMRAEPDGEDPGPGWRTTGEREETRKRVQASRLGDGGQRHRDPGSAAARAAHHQ